MTPTPPIFVLAIDEDGSEVLTFDNPRLAEGYMEPPEVRGGLYRVFDSAAHEAKLTSPWPYNYHCKVHASMHGTVRVT